MNIGEFTDALHRMTAADVRRLASALDAHCASAAGEVATWRATLNIDRALRRAHCGRVAARAASYASHAVLAAAARDGVYLPDAEVTHVARAAAELARGMTAGGEVEVDVGFLLEPWAVLVAAAT